MYLKRAFRCRCAEESERETERGRETREAPEAIQLISVQTAVNLPPLCQVTSTSAAQRDAMARAILCLLSEDWDGLVDAYRLIGVVPDQPCRWVSAHFLSLKLRGGRTRERK